MSVELYFIRHGEHDISSEEKKLTQNGVEEVTDVARILTLDPAYTLGIGPESMRFKQTVALIMYPDMPLDELSQSLNSLVTRGKYRVINGFTYIQVNDQNFYKELELAFFDGRSLHFHVMETDTYIKRTGNLISSFSHMAGQIAQQISRYQSYGIKVEEMEVVNSEVQIQFSRVFCAREFFWASFRAKSILLDQGEREMWDYVNWYSVNKERNALARKDVGHISLVGNQIHLSDSYGSHTFTTQIIDQISADAINLVSISNNI